MGPFPLPPLPWVLRSSTACAGLIGSLHSRASMITLQLISIPTVMVDLHLSLLPWALGLNLAGVAMQVQPSGTPPCLLYRDSDPSSTDDFLLRIALFVFWYPYLSSRIPAQGFFDLAHPALSLHINTPTVATLPFRTTSQATQHEPKVIFRNQGYAFDSFNKLSSVCLGAFICSSEPAHICFSKSRTMAHSF